MSTENSPSSRVTKSPTALRLAIAQSGRTQREIADEAGISEGWLSKIINGRHVDDATRAAIADVLGRNIAELFPDPPVAEAEAA